MSSEKRGDFLGTGGITVKILKNKNTYQKYDVGFTSDVSSQTQNEFIHLLGRCVKQKIIADI